MSARTRSFSTGQQRETARSRRSGRNKRAQGVARSRAMDRAVLQTRVCVYGRPCHRPGRVFSCMPSMSARAEDAHAHAYGTRITAQMTCPALGSTPGRCSRARPVPSRSTSRVRASAQNAHACMHAHGSADDTASARQHTWPLFVAAALVRRHRALPAIPRSTFRACAHAMHAALVQSTRMRARACTRIAAQMTRPAFASTPGRCRARPPPSRPPGHPRAAAQLLSRDTLESSSLREETMGCPV